MRLLLGIDLGSSSVKVTLLDADSGNTTATASYPKTEAPIKALQHGWAEQRPDDWWLYFKTALADAMQQCHADGNDIAAIGISYQMHGLVCLDRDMHPLRDAIIWCDSRGVPYGEKAFDNLGHDYCLVHLLNSPGNFTASKLAWVKDNEPDLFEKINLIMLPGDWLALKLTDTAATTACGLSEMMLWDYQSQSPATQVMDYFGFPHDIIPPIVPTFSEQGLVSARAAAELGIKAGIPVCYRAGDQPNNALSLGVFDPGQVAATAGTSGVVFSITNSVDYDPLSRINTFIHATNTTESTRLGVMHCINGCGILNAWVRRNIAHNINYDEMNALAASAPVGCDGMSIIPFGNGAERVLQNQDKGCSIQGIDFNRHSKSHILRAAQEGIAYAFYYGMEIINNLHGSSQEIHAGNANMFLSPLFREALSSVSGAEIKLYDTDGSAGAARAAGVGCGIYSSLAEAFASLRQLSVTHPDESLKKAYCEAYLRWKSYIMSQKAITSYE